MGGLQALENRLLREWGLPVPPRPSLPKAYLEAASKTTGSSYCSSSSEIPQEGEPKSLDRKERSHCCKLARIFHGSWDTSGSFSWGLNPRRASLCPVSLPQKPGSTESLLKTHTGPAGMAHSYSWAQLCLGCPPSRSSSGPSCNTVASISCHGSLALVIGDAVPLAFQGHFPTLGNDRDLLILQAVLLSALFLHHVFKCANFSTSSEGTEHEM